MSFITARSPSVNESFMCACGSVRQKKVLNITLNRLCVKCSHISQGNDEQNHVCTSQGIAFSMGFSFIL